MANKFTFKTEKSTGKYRSFYPDNHIIKLKKKECGLICDDETHKIRLMVKRNEGGFRWIALAKESKTLQEAKDFLNEHADFILKKYELHFLEN